jgi:hypothetical protein
VSAPSTAAARLRQGWIVIAVLALLSLVEYFVAAGVEHALLWLLPLTLAKAWLILDRFMHVKAVFSPGEEH